VFGGTYISKGSVYQEGVLNLVINGGTFERNVFAGMCFNSKSLMDMCYLKGDVNFTIAGGTFKNYVYGGSSSWGSDLYSRGNTIEGDINILLDASSNDHQIVFGEDSALLAGCEMYGVVDGDTKVTLKGSGENLTFNGRSLSGGCGSDGHSAGEVVTWVTVERILVMDEFNGNFDGRLVMFSEFNMNGSTVNLTYEKGSMLYDVDTWNMDESSLTGFMGNNDFTGDTLNLTYSDDAVVFDADKAAGIANWDKFNEVTINGDVANYVDGFYCTDEFKFGLDATDNTKLIITKINA